MKTKIFCTILLVISYAASFAQQQHQLDGKQYKIDMAVNGKHDSDETIVFSSGMMDPLDCHQYGFTAANYQAKVASGMTTWMSISTSEKEGKMAWQGKITGDKIEGSVVWTKDGQDPITYTFTGKESKPEKK